MPGRPQPFDALPRRRSDDLDVGDVVAMRHRATDGTDCYARRVERLGEGIAPATSADAGWPRVLVWLSAADGEPFGPLWQPPASTWALAPEGCPLHCRVELPYLAPPATA